MKPKCRDHVSVVEKGDFVFRDAGFYQQFMFSAVDFAIFFEYENVVVGKLGRDNLSQMRMLMID